MSEKLLARATNPFQYDMEDITWGEDTVETPIRKFFYKYLNNYRDKWINSNILDIGCGTGWLLNLVKKNGAKSVDGIEPSQKLLNSSKKMFPELRINNCDFQSFKTKKKYDLVFSIMVFQHFKDLGFLFKKIYKLLKSHGEIQIIVPDYNFFKESKKHRKIIDINELNSNEFLLKTILKRRGVVVDIVRKVEVYEKAAKENRLKLIEHVPININDFLISMSPKYTEDKGKTIVHLLRFVK